MKCVFYHSRIFRAGIVAALLAMIEIFVVNEPWVVYRLLGQQYSAFHVSGARIVLYIVILTIVLFWKPIFRFLKKIDFHIISDARISSLSQDNTNYAKVFVVLCMAFGLFFVFLTPPFNVPDEHNHFEQSFYLAHGQLLPKVDAQGNVYGTINSGYSAFLSEWPSVQFNANQKVSYTKIINTLQSKVDNTPQKNRYRYVYYPFVLYIPQAVGMIAGKALFHLFRMGLYYNTFQQMIFARLFNLLFYMIIVACAIRIMPVFKRTMLLLALMPMTLFVAASCSADTFVYAVSFLAVAYILRLAYSPGVRSIGKKELVCLSALCGLLLFAKSVYVLLFFLCLLIPKAKFQGWKRKLFLLLCTLLAGCAVFGAWYMAVKFSIKGMTPGSYYVWGATGELLSKSESLQMHYVLTHPFHYLLILYNDFFAQQGYLVSFIGCFGWLDTFVPTAFTVLYAALLILSALMEKFSFRMARWQRLWVFILVLGMVALVQTSAYLTWTPHPNINNNVMAIGGIQILGVQGRYFIPVAIAALFLLANRLTSRFHLLKRMDTWFGNLTAVLVVVSLNVSILYIFLRFWIN